MSIVKITPAGESITCKSGESATFQFSVSNTSGSQLRYGSEVRLDDETDWLSVEGSVEGDLSDGVDTTINVIAAPPANTVAKDGSNKSFSFRLRIYDVHKPEDAVDSATVSVEVLPAAEVPVNKPLIWPWIVAAVVILLVVGGVVWKVMQPSVMKSYVGELWIDVEDKVSEFNVTVETGYVNSQNKFVTAKVDSYEEGTVYEHVPEEGEVIPESKALTVRIALSTIEMPKVEGLGSKEALVLIKDAGLELGAKTRKLTSDVKLKEETVLNQSPKAGELVLLAGKVDLVTSQYKAKVVSKNQEQACKDYVQGKIAWDKAGKSKTWAAGNLNRLCKGTQSKFAPGNCFKYFMRSGSSWGAKKGHNITWQNGVDLCEGVTDTKKMTTCFKTEIGKGKTVEKAVNQCTVKMVFPALPLIKPLKPVLIR